MATISLVALCRRPGTGPRSLALAAGADDARLGPGVRRAVRRYAQLASVVESIAAAVGDRRLQPDADRRHSATASGSWPLAGRAIVLAVVALAAVGVLRLHTGPGG